MKKAILFIALLSFLSCKKNQKETCLLSQADGYSNGTLSNSVKYSFDDKQRVKSIITGSSTAQYTYYNDSIVADFGNMYMTYYLNSNGLVTTSVTNFCNNPNNLRHDDTYTYDSQGFLTQWRSIFSQTFLGNIIKDTTITNYVISGGNVVRTYGKNVPENFYEYSPLIMDFKNPALNMFPSAAGRFLGLSPLNLVSVIKDNTGATIITYSYLRDNSGKVIQKNINENISPDKPKELYQYNCK